MENVKFLQIEPTTRCNFLCKFCCGRHMEQKDMDFETYKNILDYFPSVEYIQLQGEGEPFLHERIFDMIDYSKQKNKKVQITTNGSMLLKCADKIIQSDLDVIFVSIETSDMEDFKKIRNGDLNEIINGIRYLQKKKQDQKLKKPLIGFSVTLLKSYKNNFGSICELYKNLYMDGGIRYQALQKLPYYTKHYSDELLKQFLTKAESILFYRDFLKMSNEIYVNNSPINFFDYKNKLLQQKDEKSCSWLENGLYINVYGVALGCCNCKDYEIQSFGNVNSNDVNEILKNRAIYRNLLKKTQNIDICAECLRLNIKEV